MTKERLIYSNVVIVSGLGNFYYSVLIFIYWESTTVMGLKCVENYLRLWYIMVLRGKRMNVFSCFLSQKAEHCL